MLTNVEHHICMIKNMDCELRFEIENCILHSAQLRPRIDVENEKILGKWKGAKRCEIASQWKTTKTAHTNIYRTNCICQKHDTEKKNSSANTSEQKNVPNRQTKEKKRSRRKWKLTDISAEVSIKNMVGRWCRYYQQQFITMYKHWFHSVFFMSSLFFASCCGSVLHHGHWRILLKTRLQ